MSATRYYCACPSFGLRTQHKRPLAVDPRAHLFGGELPFACMLALGLRVFEAYRTNGDECVSTFCICCYNLAGTACARSYDLGSDRASYVKRPACTSLAPPYPPGLLRCPHARSAMFQR